MHGEVLAFIRKTTQVGFIVNPDNLFRTGIEITLLCSDAICIRCQRCINAIRCRCQGDHIYLIIGGLFRPNIADIAVIVATGILSTSQVTMCAVENLCFICNWELIGDTLAGLKLHSIIHKDILVNRVREVLTPVGNFRLDFIRNSSLLQIVRDNLICRFKGFPRLAIVAGILPSFAPVTNARDILTGRYRRLIDAQGCASAYP